MPNMVMHRAMWVQRARTLAFCVLAVLVAASIGILAANPAHARTFTVTNTGDPGNGTCDNACTLREAIPVSNALPTTDTINFAIPDNPNVAGLEVKTISLTSRLPDITDTVTINGYTQPGGKPNDATTNANSAVLKVELNGAGAGAGTDGLTLAENDGGGTKFKGLAINRFGGDGVLVSGDGAHAARELGIHRTSRKRNFQKSAEPRSNTYGYPSRDRLPSGIIQTSP